jgi:hypothetical protein
MRKSISLRVLVGLLTAAFFGQYLAANAHAQQPDNSHLRIREINIEHQLENDPPDTWRQGPVSPRAVRLKFLIEFEPPSGTEHPLPPEIHLRVELRRLCRLNGPGGDLLFSRFQDFFTSFENNVAINNRRTEIEVQVHCPTCPHPRVCQFRGTDPDHLGEGPYEALLTAGNATEFTAGNGTALAATAGTERLVHSQFFSTCQTRCPLHALTDAQRRSLKNRQRAGRRLSDWKR